jgi:hypothetical protein
VVTVAMDLLTYFAQAQMKLVQVEAEAGPCLQLAERVVQEVVEMEATEGE